MSALIRKQKEVFSSSNVSVKPSWVFDWTDNHGHIFKDLDLTKWKGGFDIHTGELEYLTGPNGMAGEQGYKEYENRLKLYNWNFKEAFLMTYDKKYKMMNDADYKKDEARLHQTILQEVGGDFGEAGKQIAKVATVAGNAVVDGLAKVEKAVEDKAKDEAEDILKRLLKLLGGSEIGTFIEIGIIGFIAINILK